jgi:AcrR family transcriptional regulator
VVLVVPVAPVADIQLHFATSTFNWKFLQCSALKVTMKNTERRALSLDKVLEASRLTLEGVGYNRMRTADVAKRSGMSEGTLFRYFPTKYDLTRASLQLALNRHTARLIESISVLPQPVERRQLLDTLWELLSHHEMAWTYELFAASYSDPELRAAIAPTLNAHSNEVDELAVVVLRDMAGIAPEDALLAINLSTWAMQGLVLRNMGRGQAESHVALLDYIVFLADSAYGRVEASHSTELPAALS